MQKTSIGIIAALLVFLTPCSGFAYGEYRGIIPEKLAWAFESINEQWTQTKDIDSEMVEQYVYHRSGITDEENSTPVEERYNRQLVITLEFVNLSSETYSIDSSSHLEASFVEDGKTVRANAVPTIDKTVVVPGDRLIKYSFVLKMNDRDFIAAFDKRYDITEMTISPVNGNVLIKDSKGNSLLDNVQDPAVICIQSPLHFLNVCFFPKQNSALTVKDALLSINKTEKVLSGKKDPTRELFKIDNDEIVSVFHVPNSKGFFDDDFRRLLLFMFNGEPVDNEKTAEILSKPLRPDDIFRVGIVPEDVLNKYFPDDQTRLLYYFSKCIEKLPESIAPKRYQDVNIKCIYDKINPLQTLLKYAESGDNEAIELIYNFYDPNQPDGVLFEKFPDQKSFFQWLKKLADNGSSQAQLYVGIYYGNGIAVKEDLDEAIRYYKMAADQDNTDAMVCCSNALYKKDKEKYRDENVEWLRMAAERKNLRGQFLLAVVLLASQDDEQKKEGLLWLQQASFEGYPDAMFGLALEYYTGINIPQDYKKAFDLMEDAALDKGLIKAYDVLGYFYMKGVGVEPDEEQAFLCYQIGAENGIPNSMYWYGYFLCCGVNVEKDVSKGYKLIKEAAEKGITEAMIFISHDFYKGGIAEKDDKKAFYWLEKAYNEGDEYATGPLGDYYMFGVGVKADKEKALELYKSSADKGFPYGYFRWGQYLYEQKGENAQMGLDYIKKAAKMELKIAQEYLDNLEDSSAGKDDSKIDNNQNDAADDLDEEDE